MSQYRHAVFLHHRDLRIDDNTGLLRALASSSRVSGCFIFNPHQVEPHPYRSDFGLKFMLESLVELSADYERVGGVLSLCYGDTIEVLGEWIKKGEIDAVFSNRDYTPFAIQRDRAIEQLCQKLGCAFSVVGDSLLHEPEELTKADGTPYTVFTPFYKRSLTVPVRVPEPFKSKRAPMLSPTPLPGHAPQHLKSLMPLGLDGAALRGGRSQALKVLEDLGRFAHYQQERDIPVLDRTTHLSPHHKFGTVSAREVHARFLSAQGAASPVIRELYWRDFFSHIAFHFPHVFKGAFQRRYDALRWDTNKARFQAWCEGRTGFPLVDAGMLQLNRSGYMHNRVRMVVASFLIKDLHIDWRWGERYFATKLVDFDPSVNNGSWQWCASTGCDAQPYFRIFNPWLQQKRFDPECLYIRHWLPELREVPVGVIHDETRKALNGYPAPMLEHAHEKAETEERYAEVQPK